MDRDFIVNRIELLKKDISCDRMLLDRSRKLLLSFEPGTIFYDSMLSSLNCHAYYLVRDEKLLSHYLSLLAVLDRQVDGQLSFFSEDVQ